MRKLKVLVCKTGNGVSAHIEGVDGFVIARNSVYQLKRDLPDGLKFHTKGLNVSHGWMANILLNMYLKTFYEIICSHRF